MASAPRRGRTKIKAPQKHGPEVSMEETWSALSKNIRIIQDQKETSLSFEENHRFAYNMVLHKHGAVLYNGVCALVAEHLDNLTRDRIIPTFPSGRGDDPMHQSQEAEILLKALRDVWDDHSSSMQRLGQVLKYMDRVYTKMANVPEIWDAGLDLFLKHIIRPPIKDHLVTAILNLIRVERDGYMISGSAVKGCVSVLLPLTVGRDGPSGSKKDLEPAPSVYKRDVEPRILEESNTYYTAEAQKLLASCNAPEYIRKVEARLEAEELRAMHYLSPQTAGPLRQIVENSLVSPHLETLVTMPNSGLDVMIDMDQYHDLARLYRLFVMVSGGLVCLKKALKQSIDRRGQEVNRASFGTDTGDVLVDADGLDEGKPLKGKVRPPNVAAQTLSLALKWVQDVLDLKEKIDKIWKKSFQTNRELESGINEAFGIFINLNEKSPEYISLFIDENLKKGLKGKTDHEMEIVLEKTTIIFRYIADKDVFERYYKGHLAKRLLQGRSVSDDAERGMLAKLKVECGYQFTHKLEGMFHDMKLSVDTMHAYQGHLAKTTAPEINISVTVLTSTFWPVTQGGLTCTLPPELDRACRSFEQFYFSRHSGRRLTWQPSLGNADVRVTFKAKTHEINVSTFALVILLLFQSLPESEFLTYEEIQAGTSIVEGELRRHLQSLACAKFKILRKHPPGREVEPGDSFSFNSDFTSSLQKIKISTIASRVETGEERKETLDRVDEERRHQTEACIVRIMKNRKHMTHNDLVNEVTRQLASRFRPDPLSIKKRIEGLIEREYLERCADRKSYNYLA